MKDFNTPLSLMDKSSRQKLNREILKLTDVINQMNLRDSYRPYYPITKDIPSSHHLIELFPKFTIYSDTKQDSMNTRKLK